MENKYALQVKSVSQSVWIKNKRKKILSDLDLNIQKGEFIAIVGCSGAGKTTLMNILSGYNKPTTGTVYIDGLNLFEEEEYFKGKIAYVPQQEILDQTLTLQKSLEYSYLLRVKDSSTKEMKQTINRILKLVELSHVRNTLIKNLSGGEKKRASIATEMLNNPNLFLLDEPTSGLDANIEKKIMLKLREIANLGKTIIITAHTVSNLNLCDKVIFMGKDGKICYFGSFDKICSYFEVKEFVDIYDLLKKDTNTWHKKYLSNQEKVEIQENTSIKEKRKRMGIFCQTRTLVKRYVSSLINNKFMLVLLLGQSVLMGSLICLAMEKGSFLNPVTSSMLCIAFTLAAIWLGLFNTIQEIVKEKEMLKKEYMSGLHFTSYILSKIIVFSILCFYQAITCVSIVYFYLDPRPEDILIISTLFGLVFNFFLLSFSTSMIGILISALAKDAKTTLIISPLYMMFQMLFSGMFVPFVTLTKNISYVVLGRWGYEGFATISNLSKYGVLEPAEGFFDFQSSHIIPIWGLFIGAFFLFLCVSIYAIRRKVLAKDIGYSLFLDDANGKMYKGKHHHKKWTFK